MIISVHTSETPIIVVLGEEKFEGNERERGGGGGKSYHKPRSSALCGKEGVLS